MSTEHNPEPRQSDFPYPFVAHITPDAGKAEAHEICGNLHCPAAHVTHYQGEHPSCAAKLSETPAQQPAQEPCLTCEGHGIIGGYEGSGNDMSPVGYPCPDCNPPAQQPAEAMPETETPIAYAIYGLDALGRHFLHDVRVPENDDWKSDDGGLGDRWTGNSPLYSIKQELEIRLTAALAELSRLREEIERIKKEESERFEHIREALATERAAREQTEVEASGLRMAVAIANKSADDQMFQKRAAEHSLAESESREHQAREALNNIGHACGISGDRLGVIQALASQALLAPTSTTVADLRKRAETAERERDAAVKDTKRLDWLENTKAECYSVEGKEQAEGSKLWKIAGKNGFHVTLRAAIDAAIATTQETK